jgi:hypothetical protein
VAAPVVRDVLVRPPRSGALGSEGPVQEATVSCYTGRLGFPGATDCTVVAEHGPTTAYGTTTAPTPLGTYHEFPIGGLTPGATYHVRVKATDPADAATPAYSQDYAFVQTPNDVPPGPTIVHQPLTGITATTATVNWTTNPACPSGTVQYSLTPTLQPLLSKSETGGNVTTHAVSLTGLTATTRYYYRVVQPSVAGGTTVSSLLSFVTT